MITEKNMRVFDIKHNNKNFKVIVDNKELVIITEAGVFRGTNPSGFNSFFAAASPAELIPCIATKSVFDLVKSKERTTYKTKVITSGMNINKEIVDQIIYRINRKKNVDLNDFLRFCIMDFTALCPELIKQDAISLCMTYPKAAVEAIDVFVQYVQPKLCENIDEKYHSDLIIVDYYSKNGPDLYPTNYRGINDRIKTMHDFYSILYNSGMLKNIAFEYKEYDDVVYFALEVKKLGAFFDANIDNEVVISAASHFLIGSMAPCNMSGAIQPGAVMSTYRDNNGCVGRSHECTIVQQLDTQACGMIYDEKKRCGVKDAVSLAFSLYCFKK